VAQSEDDGIPRDVQEFLRRAIRSVEQLEILLLLRRTHFREWTALEVATELRGHPESAAHRLALLHEIQIVTQRPSPPLEPNPAPRYVFEPSAKDAPVVASLDLIYANKRSRVINFIFSPPSDPVRSFADAFKLRKD